MTVKGTLYVVASPSGGGKTSLIKALIESVDNIEVSISHTTRPQREGEVQQQHYFFIQEEEFKGMVASQAFIEHACVFGHYYGTSKEQIESRLEQGMDVLLDIDWQGARQLNSLFTNVVSIFILPPSLEVLRQRLCARAQDEDDTINKRMQKAKDEISHYKEFDYIVINDDFDKALTDICSIVYAERLRCQSQEKRNQALLSNLLD